MVYQGKELQVFLDGRPLNIYSDELTSYLESLPANSIDKVEIITQPGAEFPATAGGAIINIVSSNNAKNYLNATYANGYSYTNYGQARHRFNNSILVNAKNKLFSWEVQAGQSFREAWNLTKINNNQGIIANNNADNTNRYYFLNSGIKFGIKKDKLLLNYNFSNNNSASLVNSVGNDFVFDNLNRNDGFRHDLALSYNKRFKRTDRKLNLQLNYVNNNNDFNQTETSTLSNILNNSYNRDFYQARTDYSQEVNILDKSKFSLGALAEFLDFQAKDNELVNLDYTQKTLAAYAEFKTEIGNFDLIAGGRLESYDLTGRTDQDDLIPFETTRFFPNFTVQYKIAPSIFANINYNKKITLPNSNNLNPNNTRLQNPNLTFGGNPFLEPTIFNNYSLNLTAYEYFYVNYSVSSVDNSIQTRLFEDANNNVSIVPQNISEATIHSLNFGIPLPYMLFTKGLKETLKFDFNPDKINFLYIGMGYQKPILPDVETQGVWNFFLMSQIILPKDINFTATYTRSTTGGNYYYFIVNQPNNHSVDLNFSKKFLDDDLSISLLVNDLFNTNRNEYLAVNTTTIYNRKFDSRRIGFSLTYKLPTKNKGKQERIIDSQNTEENLENQQL